jgi:hypothetical protein
MSCRLLLSFILFIAGFFHLLYPQAFYPAIPFTPKFAINLLAGLFEIVLALLLWSARFRDLAAKLSALWFLGLIPIHVYVSINKISMFGIDNAYLLWLRTLFQPAFYFLAIASQKNGWVISQRWEHLIFMHYRVNADKVQSLVPFPLDLYQGHAVVSIVPFVMKRIRFPFLMPLPGLAQLLELNLRTYIIVNGKPAVYFFTLDSNHLPGVLIARWFFSLPYRWVKLTFNLNPTYHFTSPDFDLTAHIEPQQAQSPFDVWASERYALFTKRGEDTYVGEVQHAKWKLQSVTVMQLRDCFSPLFAIDLNHEQFIGATYSAQIDVKFKPFRQVI